MIFIEVTSDPLVLASAIQVAVAISTTIANIYLLQVILKASFASLVAYAHTER